MVNMGNNRKITNILIYQGGTYVKSLAKESNLAFLKNAAIAHYIVDADTTTIHQDPKKMRDYFKGIRSQ